MTYDEMIAVIEAAKEGKTIQTKLKRTTIEYDRMLYAAVWQDGHPCGIEE